MRRLIKLLTILLALPVGMGALYLACALLCAVFPYRGRAQVPSSVELPLYVCGDIVHTDLAIPVHDTSFNGEEIFGTSIQQQFSNETYYYIGWGDYVFLTQLGKISDASLAMIISALTGKNPSAVRLRPGDDPSMSKECHQIAVDAMGRQALRNYISTHLHTPANVVSWSAQDHTKPSTFYFFTDKHYSPFSTCNQWTSNALKEAGIAHAAFSPLSFGVIWPLKHQKVD